MGRLNYHAYKPCLRVPIEYDQDNDGKYTNDSWCFIEEEGLRFWSVFHNIDDSDESSDDGTIINKRAIVVGIETVLDEEEVERRVSDGVGDDREKCLHSL